MRQPKKGIIGKKVVTSSGQELGVVSDVEIDNESHVVIGYHVKKSKLLPEFIAGELLIRPKQVVKITPTAMVVEDLLVRGEDPAATTQPAIGSL